MNAPISLVNLSKQAVQPQASGIFLAEYPFDKLTVYLYGHVTSRGYTVESVVLPGSRIDLCDMLTNEKMVELDEWCDSNLPSKEQL